MKHLLVLFALLFAALPAQAQTVRLQEYPVETLPFGCEVRFVSGVQVEEQALFLLVDTLDFNGCYLELMRGEDERFHSAVSGIRIPQGWTAQVDAPDADHCRLTLSAETETRSYSFRFVPLMDEGDWELEGYVIQTPDSRFEVFVPGLWRMEATETGGGQVRKARAAWYFRGDCENLDLEQLPASIDDLRRLEQEQPVAAIAPQDGRDRVNLRQGPGTDHPRVGSLYSGVMLQLTGEADGEWLHVNPVAGATRQAWVKRSLLAFGEEIWQVPDAAVKRLVVSGQPLVPVDDQPYRTSDPLGFIPSGVQVNVIGYYNDDWAIIGRNPGALYVESCYLGEP